MALFDLFEDEKVLGAGKRSMAYTITYQDPTKTLTDDEVNQLQERLRQMPTRLPSSSHWTILDAIPRSLCSWLAT